MGHDSAVKPTKGGKTSGGGYAAAVARTVDAGGIDWRFADPAADALAVLNCEKLAGSRLAHGLIDQLGASQGLKEAALQRIFRGLSGVEQVALSVREDQIVLMIAGRSSDAILPAPVAGWKTVSFPGNLMLIGHSEAVDRAAQRIWAASLLGDMAQMALERPADSEFWAVGSAKLAGPEAVAAGVKRFSLTASMQDRFASDTIFEFAGAPDAGAIRAWVSSLGDAKIEGNVVYAKTSIELDAMAKSSGQIAGSPFGRRFAALIQSAQYLPVRDTAATVHTKAVIYGLDDGAREAKQ
jgi:hypothetical protein